MSGTIDKDIARPATLPARSSQGVVLGLDPWQVSTLLLAGAVLLISVQVYGPVGVISGGLIGVALAVASVVRYRGMSLPRWGAVWMNKKMRDALGATKETFAPEAAQPTRVGALRLPGRLASVEIWEVGDLAAVYDPHGRSITVMAELEVPGFLMKDLYERMELADRWAMVLASFTQRPGVKRVAMQERTFPATIRPARDYFEEHKGNLSVPSADERYQAVMDKAEGFAVAHRNYLTLTYDLLKLSGQLKALGGGKAAAVRLAALEAGNIRDALAGAEVEVRRWLGPRDIAALARTAFDPASIPVIENRTGSEAGVDPVAMGPTYMEEPKNNLGIVHTDSGVHTTMWIHEWPRAAAPIGFVNDLVFARHPVDNTAISHIFTTVMTPVPITEAFKRIKREKKTWRANQRMKARRGEDGNAIDTADFVALQAQEDGLVSGHGEYRYGGYLTVTAATEEELEQSIAGVRNALSRAGMEAQILYAQQGEALLINALPIGLGLK
ncbi:SCO6880 family protein [Microbacterium sp. NPDC080220]|uniref:SCO6880 family protein n=1 Tax=Microbacterium sp. NPDC080220 TaxID=3161017 RepID=UPI0034127F0D